MHIYIYIQKRRKKMSKKKTFILSLSLVASAVATAAALALSVDSESVQLGLADPTQYSLTINRSTQKTESNANKYVLTTSGNKFSYHFGNAAYDEEEVTANDAICMLRDNGSGIYFDSPIQKIESFSIKFDMPGTIHVYFSNTKGSFTGEDCYLESEVVYEPTTVTENVYILLWCNITTYVESISITYACE